MRDNNKHEVIIVGGGVIGCSIAYSLAKRGVTSLVLEKGQAGDEASAAAAGMLGAQVETLERSPLVDLCLASRAMYRGFAQELYDLTDIQIDYNDAGILRVATQEADRDALLTRHRWQSEMGESVAWLTADDCLKLEPNLTPDLLGGLYFENDHQVNNVKLGKALVSAIKKKGVIVREGIEVHRLIQKNGRVIGVSAEQEEFYADHVIVAGGAWSSTLLESVGWSLPVFPIKGQSFSVEQNPLPITRTIYAHGCYMVPKRDGALIIGATEEDAGFDKKVSLSDIAQLNEAACSLVPSLRQANFIRAWAGLRPTTPDKLPYLGAVEAHPGLWVATGHFRNGILLTPITGELIADLITGATPAVELTPFSPLRYMYK